MDNIKKLHSRNASKVAYVIIQKTYMKITPNHTRQMVLF
jgi:hypothetical protein